ncbi:hypothetical protein SAMN05216226_106134 [Halovenus aranensis]|uniref:DUF7978 domain-containing protein n=1 Tax=Halovenus aranensis TaxID=890420 RepID=A0A1G8VBX6_9EURY|nr:hypothetical protein [Halovenus aranensis]SDJ63622.1 hypothetical protein SAMN05216226_106134 [Halovenus aranensis]
MSEQSESGLDKLPVVDSSVHGVTAYAGGYLATLLLFLVFEGERFIGDVVEGAGWLFYNAQFVPVEQRASLAGPVVEDLASINYLTGQGLDAAATSSVVVPAVVYHAIPVVAYVVAGAALVQSAGVQTPRTGAKLGASMVLGTIILAVGGTFIFEAAGQIGPNRLYGVLLVGVAYPGICGAIGGVLGVTVDA